MRMTVRSGSAASPRASDDERRRHDVDARVHREQALDVGLREDQHAVIGDGERERRERERRARGSVVPHAVAARPSLLTSLPFTPPP